MFSLLLFVVVFEFSILLLEFVRIIFSVVIAKVVVAIKNVVEIIEPLNCDDE